MNWKKVGEFLVKYAPQIVEAIIAAKKAKEK